MPGDPNWIDNLRISVHESYKADPGLRDRQVYISVDQSFLWVKVTGEDPGWVRGRAGELQDLISSTKAKWVISPQALAGISGAGFGIYLVVSVFLLILLISHFRLIYAIGLWICLALYFGGFVLYRKMSRRAQNQLNLLPARPPAKRDWIGILTLAATILILIATVVAVIKQ